LDLQVLVAQLQFHEQLAGTLVLLQLVQVQQVQAQLLVVVLLELVEHPYLPKKFGVQKKLKLQENLAYLF
jgi:hypothetical protein